LKLPDWVEGVLVTDVDPAGPARVAQLRVNHVILEINRRPVRSDGEYRSAVNRLTDGEAAALLVYEKSTGQRAIFTVVSDAP
jgi:S1-C subfamily serine protease